MLKVWPPAWEPMAENALRAFQGGQLYVFGFFFHFRYFFPHLFSFLLSHFLLDVVFYVGEPCGGATATDGITFTLQLSVFFVESTSLTLIDQFINLFSKIYLQASSRC